MNIDVQIFLWALDSILLGECPELELLDYMAILHLIFWGFTFYFLLSCFQADILFVCKFAFPGQVPLSGLVLQLCGLRDAKGPLRSYHWEWAAYRRILLFWYFVYHSYSYFGQICSISCFKSLAFAFLSGIQKPFQFHMAKTFSFTSSSRKNNYHLPALQDERMFIKQLEHLPEKS